MDFKQWLSDISEAPIGGFERLGDWSPKKRNPLRGFDRASVGILNSDKGVEKIKRQWSKTKEVFDLYFVRSPKNSSYSFRGEVSEEWVRDKERGLGLDNINFDEDHISVIYAGNIQGNVPLTGWVLAHRFGHAIFRTHEWGYFSHSVFKYLEEIAKQIYGRREFEWEKFWSYPTPKNSADALIRALSHGIGTMKSAREGNIESRFEFLHELLAQYITTGKLTFNAKLPQVIHAKKRFYQSSNKSKMRSTPDETREMEEYLNGHVKDSLENSIDYMLSSFTGRIFVV